MKTPLIERMQKGGAAKAWIKEVEAKDREILDLEQIKVQYLSIINLLDFEKEELDKAWARHYRSLAESLADAYDAKLDEWREYVPETIANEIDAILAQEQEDEVLD